MTDADESLGAEEFHRMGEGTRDACSMGEASYRPNVLRSVVVAGGSSREEHGRAPTCRLDSLTAAAADLSGRHGRTEGAALLRATEARSIAKM